MNGFIHPHAVSLQYYAFCSHLYSWVERSPGYVSQTMMNNNKKQRIPNSKQIY